MSLLPPPAPSARPSPFYSVYLDAGFVRLARTAARFETRAQVNEARLWVGRQLDAIGRAGRNILIDSRLAHPSTDFEHGAEFRELRRETERGFVRVAVLVQSKLGVLQAHRIATQDKSGLLVFEDEPEAIEYVKGGLAKRGP